VNLELTRAEHAFEAEARAWLEANVPREEIPSGDTAEGFTRLRLWERKLFEAGWAAVSWPRAYGGRESSIIEWLIFEEEYYRAGAPQRIAQNGIFLLAPTLLEHGTEAQKEHVLPRMGAGLDVWAQAWSEPEAGSDLAGIKSKAEKCDGGWRLSGQKCWCTRGAFCDWAFGLFRTDPQAERHRGLTYFMFPLRAPGITVRPVGRLDGDPGFADVFLDRVFAPDRDVIGTPNDGWNVAMSTASSERGLSLRSPGRFLAAAERLVALYKRRPDPSLRDEVARAWMDARAYDLYTKKTAARAQRGEKVGPESSINKVFWSEMDVRLHETALRLLGPELELDGPWMRGFEFALAGPIYAGTNEIQRNVIAERVLGLPRR
jgi:alkylation response protein AidB-like acyl-CoA dehydrogenase